MQKLIGIRGHRGAGKESVAYLLASAIEYFNNPGADEPFDVMYQKAVDRLVENKDEALSNIELSIVYLDAFGDAPKAMVQQLLGCDFKYLWEEYWKDHAVVDLQTFEVEEVEVLPDGLITADDLKDGFGVGRMSLREFILYFGINVMQKYFGQDVWVKSTARNDMLNEEGEFTSDGIRIYTDIKAPTELAYVIGRGGKIINVERKGYKKKGGLDLLKGDDRWDYLIEIKGDDLMSIKDDIKQIAESLLYDRESIENQEVR